MKIFICEDSIDGIFTAVYHAYASRYGHKNIRLITADALDSYELFCEYEEISTDTTLSAKVTNTLRQRFGMEIYQDICHAIYADEPQKTASAINKAEAVYKTIVFGLSMPNPLRLLENLANPYICRVFELSRRASNEAQHLFGFLRFQELENGVLFARIHPQNDILPLVATHFCDRLPQENFIIYDENRKMAAFHKAGAGFLLANVSDINEDFLHRFSKTEVEYQALWQTFFSTIAIEARKNPKLQNQNIPKRFQRDAIEFTAVKL